MNAECESVPPAPRTVIDDVARAWGYTKEEIQGAAKTKRLSSARKQAVRRLYDECGMSFPEIGHLLGGRGHGAIMYLYRAV